MYPFKHLVGKKPKGYHFKTPENEASVFLTILKKFKKITALTPDLAHTKNNEAVTKKCPYSSSTSQTDPYHSQITFFLMLI